MAASKEEAKAMKKADRERQSMIEQADPTIQSLLNRVAKTDLETATELCDIPVLVEHMQGHDDNDNRTGE